ncbi:MAG: D-glycero-beta-D-manno-heptose 1-phosphate adenylyltransferase [Bacteroidetes bacterium]|nr:D-glycero-beta-D-manno-heptose 1-phosphate adenylyltransferase [Bacteroidota bacterium]
MIKLLKDISNIVKELRKENKKIVFTNGCFDILHSGHCKYLNQAKELGDVLIVGLNTDASVRRIKAEMNRPINDELNRAIVLDSLRAVDYVVLFDENTPYNLIAEIIPDILVKGSDYNIKDIIGGDIVINNGGKVITIDLLAGQSTTNIIEKIKKIINENK